MLRSMRILPHLGAFIGKIHNISKTHNMLLDGFPSRPQRFPKWQNPASLIPETVVICTPKHVPKSPRQIAFRNTTFFDTPKS
jgi:hypothetical protein